jgi:hypothetical protein
MSHHADLLHRSQLKNIADKLKCICYKIIFKFAVLLEMLRERSFFKLRYKMLSDFDIDLCSPKAKGEEWNKVFDIGRQRFFRFQFKNAKKHTFNL